MSDCVFCKIIDRTIPSTILVETDDLIVIKDIAPKAPFHRLIIPKKHIPDIQSLSGEDTALAGNMLMMAQRLALDLPDPKAFRLLVNSGADAGQKVFHLHIHMLSGAKMHDF